MVSLSGQMVAVKRGRQEEDFAFDGNERPQKVTTARLRVSLKDGVPMIVIH